MNMIVIGGKETISDKGNVPCPPQSCFVHPPQVYIQVCGPGKR